MTLISLYSVINLCLAYHYKYIKEVMNDLVIYMLSVFLL